MYLTLLLWFWIAISLAYITIKYLARYNIFTPNKNLKVYLGFLCFYFLFIYWIWNFFNLSNILNNFYILFSLLVLEETIKLSPFIFSKLSDKVYDDQIILQESLFFVFLFSILESCLYFLFNQSFFLQNIFILLFIRFWLNILLHILYSYWIIILSQKYNLFFLGIILVSIIHFNINLWLWYLLKIFV